MCLVEITGDKNTFEQPYRTVQNSLGNLAVQINFIAKIKPKISFSHYENVQPNSIHPKLNLVQSNTNSFFITRIHTNQGFACDCSHLYILAYKSLLVKRLSFPRISSHGHRSKVHKLVLEYPNFLHYTLAFCCFARASLSSFSVEILSSHKDNTGKTVKNTTYLVKNT